MLPLCLAVLPWGILCGSLAVQNGFSALETQAMSLLVFAGSAQLVAIELMAGNTPLLTILFTTLIISSRHFLYGLAIRHKVIDQPFRWRLPVSFVLTDELFAFSHHRKAYRTKVRLIYALSAGFSFYIAWNIWTFIALVIPGVKNLATLATVLTAGVVATLLKSQGFQLWLVTAALIAMTVGYLIGRWQTKEEHTL